MSLYSRVQAQRLTEQRAAFALPPRQDHMPRMWDQPEGLSRREILQIHFEMSIQQRCPTCDGGGCMWCASED